MTSNVTYVSSIDNREKRSKLNNVIESLNKFVTCTTPDTTRQEYGYLSYCGPVCVGQFIQGDKRAMKAGTPVTAMGVYLGKINNDGLLKVENVESVTFSECTCPATITVTRNFTFDPSAAGGQSSYFCDTGWVCCMTHTASDCTDSCGVCHIVDVWTCTYTKQIIDFCYYNNAYPGTPGFENGSPASFITYVCNYDNSGRIVWKRDNCDVYTWNCTCYCGFPHFYGCCDCSLCEWGTCLCKSSASSIITTDASTAYSIYNFCIPFDRCEYGSHKRLYNACAYVSYAALIDTCCGNQGTKWFFDGNYLRYNVTYYHTLCYRFHRCCFECCWNEVLKRYDICNASGNTCVENVHLGSILCNTSQAFVNKTDCITDDGHIKFMSDLGCFLGQAYGQLTFSVCGGDFDTGCRFSDCWKPKGIIINHDAGCPGNEPYVWGRFCGCGVFLPNNQDSVLCASTTGHISLKATTCCVCVIVRCRETCRFDFSCDICLCERYY